MHTFIFGRNKNIQNEQFVLFDRPQTERVNLMSAIQQNQVNISNRFGLEDLNDNAASAINGGMTELITTSSQRIEGCYVITVSTSKRIDSNGDFYELSGQSIEPLESCSCF